MNNKNLRLIYIFLSFIIIVVGAYKLLQMLNPKPSSILKSFPLQNSANVDVSAILMFLLDPPLKNAPEIQAVPTFPFKFSLENQNTVLVLSPQEPLSYDTKYQISLSGKDILPFTLTFTTSAPPVPTPTLPLPTTPNNNTSTEDILKKLPLVTDKYTIEYFPNIKKFLVLIQKSPYEENKKLVEDWLRQNGIQNLSLLNIEYGSTREVSY